MIKSSLRMYIPHCQEFILSRIRYIDRFWKGLLGPLMIKIRGTDFMGVSYYPASTVNYSVIQNHFRVKKIVSVKGHGRESRP